MRTVHSSDWRYREARAALWLWSDGRCWYCGERVQPRGRTIDHVVPNGEGAWANLVPACMGCNCAKWVMSLCNYRSVAGPFYGEINNLTFPPKNEPLAHPFEYPKHAKAFSTFRDRLTLRDIEWFGRMTVPTNFGWQAVGTRLEAERG